MTTRHETPADGPLITAVIHRAFAGHPHSRGTEAAIVHQLRTHGALTVSLVGELDGEVRGHVVASPVTIGGMPSNWYGLGPVAVDPASQLRGLGTRLVNDCLAALRRLGASGCVVLGAPSYYARFGFRPLPGLVYPGPPADHFMAHSFDGSRPAGEVGYHPAFDVEA